MNKTSESLQENPGTNRFRVLILVESYLPVIGGMESQTRNLAVSLHSNGIPVTILTRCPERHLPRHESIDGIPVIRIGPVGPSSRMRWPMVLTALLALYRYRKDYDIIFVAGFRALGLSAVWAGKWFKKRTILKAESSGEFSGAFFSAGFRKSGFDAKSRLAAWLIRTRNRQLLKADAFVGLSSEQAQEYRDQGANPERIHIIPNGLDESMFSPAQDNEKADLRRKLGLPIDEHLILYTGRLVSYKGLPCLVKAWKDICNEQRSGHLILVGEGGVDMANCEDELRQQVQDNRLSKRVTFTGAVSNVQEYLKAADVYAFPTENEAFGLSLVEAMACGLAVMSTTTGGITDFLENERNGLVVRVADSEDIKKQLTRLLRDSELRKRLGNAARQTVVSRFTIDGVAKQYIELFNTSTTQ